MSEKRYDVILHATFTASDGSTTKYHKLLNCNVSFEEACRIAHDCKMSSTYNYKTDAVTIRVSETESFPTSWFKSVEDKNDIAAVRIELPKDLQKQISVDDKGMLIVQQSTFNLRPAKENKFAVVFKHQGLEVSIFAFSRKELAEQYCKELTEDLKPWSRIHFFVKEVK